MFFDKTCCSPNSTLPGQLMCGADIISCFDEIIPLVIDFLKVRGLQLSKEKSKITHINDGFDFLSQNIRKYKGKLVIRPSKESVANLYLPEFDKYFFQRRKWREDLAKECKQITTFIEMETNIIHRFVSYIGHMELLGYGIYRMRNQKFGLKVTESNWQSFVRRCKSITRMAVSQVGFYKKRGLARCSKPNSADHSYKRQIATTRLLTNTQH